MVGLVDGLTGSAFKSRVHGLTAIALPGPSRLSLEGPCSVVPLPPCLAASNRSSWRRHHVAPRLSTAKPCLRIVTPRLIGHAFFAVQSLRDPLKAKLLDLWSEMSPPAREVFDIVALKTVRRRTVEVQI